VRVWRKEAASSEGAIPAAPIQNEAVPGTR